MNERPVRRLAGVAALTLLVASFAMANPARRAQQQSPEMILGTALHLEEIEGDFPAAIAKYAEVVAHTAADPATASRALIRMGTCYEKLGDPRATAIYERVINDFADLPEAVAEALVRLRALGVGETLELPGQELVSRRIFHYPPRMNPGGTPSPDGLQFSRTDWASGDIAVMNLSNGEMRRLSHDGYPGMAFGSIFSPDGRTIAYGWIGGDDQSGLWSLRLIDVDGGERRVLYTPDPGFYGMVQAWSPDGSWILVAVATGETVGELVAVSVADGSARVLKQLPDIRDELSGNAPGSSISPDGQWVAHDFEYGPDGHRNISLLSVADGVETPLVASPATDRTPVWTPDGRQVLFVSDRGGSFDLWAQAVLAGAPQGVPKLLRAGIDNVIGITDDGSLYYNLGRTYFDLRTALYDADTGTLTPQTQTGFTIRSGLNSRPSWSPDGRRLLYYHRPIGTLGGGERTIVILDVDTGEEQEVILSYREFGGAMKPLGWTPDGARVLAYGFGRDPNGPALYWIDVESGTTELIIEGWTVSARLSPDGSTVYIPSLRPDGIVAIDLASGDERRIGPPIGEAGISDFGFALSPDGRTLAYQPGGWEGPPGAGLVLLDIESGATRVFEGLPFYWELAWTPDGRYVLGTRGPGDWDGVSEEPVEAVVWKIPVDGGDPEPSAVTIGSDPAFGGLVFHPDGRTLTYVDGTQGSEIWVIEKLLPSAGR